MASFDLFDPEAAPKGVAVHMKTPFLENGWLDEASFARTARHSVDIGAAMLIMGQRGCEVLALSEAERERTLEISLDAARGRIPVCATATALTLPDMIAIARRYEDMGADAMSVLPPSWIASKQDNMTCVRAVAEAISIPFFARCTDWGHRSTVEELAQLALDVPNVRYLKEEMDDWPRRLTELFKRPGGQRYLRVMVGMLPPGMIHGYRAGARLWMCAADITEVLIAIFGALEAGDDAEARRIQDLLTPLCWFKSYVRGQLDNKMTLYRRGLFDSPRGANLAWTHGLEELTAEEEDELTEMLRPLALFFEKYPPRL